MTRECTPTRKCIRWHDGTLTTGTKMMVTMDAAIFITLQHAFIQARYKNVWCETNVRINTAQCHTVEHREGADSDRAL